MKESGDAADTKGMSEKRSSNVTAWVLDENISVAAEGATLAGVPGIWKPGVPVHPEAFGMSVKDFQQAVTDLDLPLTKVTVKESEAIMQFEPGPNHYPSQVVGTGMIGGDAEAQARMLAAGGIDTLAATAREADRIDATPQDEAHLNLPPVEEA